MCVDAYFLSPKRVCVCTVLPDAKILSDAMNALQANKAHWNAVIRQLSADQVDNLLDLC